MTADMSVAGSSGDAWAWLVRHPRPVAARGLCYGRLDVAVQPASTARITEKLSACLPEGLTLSSSPRQRCLILAEQLQVLRPDIRVLPPQDWLAEMDLGAWEGNLWADIPAAELGAWTDAFGHYRAGGTGESMADFLARIAAGLRAQAVTPSPQVWITHAGVIRAVHWLLQPMGLSRLPTAQEWPGTKIDFGEICLLTDRHRSMLQQDGRH